MDEVIQTATVIAVFLFFLGIFHGSHQAHHELLHDSFDTIWVLTIHPFILLDTLFLQMCQAYSRHVNHRLGPFNFCRGRNWSTWVWLYYQGYGYRRVPWSLPFWLPSWFADSQSMSSPVGWPSGRPLWP